MLSTDPRLDGTSRYAALGVLSQSANTDPLVIQVFSAQAGEVRTKAYVDLIGDQLETPSARYLFHFDERDLEDLEAWIVMAHSGGFELDRIVAARHLVRDETGTLWLRGMFVDPSQRGRRISPALAAVGFADLRIREEPFREVAGGLIMDGAVPNPKSLKAVQKAGFQLTEDGGVIPLLGTHRDRHLMRYAEMIEGQPSIRYRKTILPQDKVAEAIRFIARWRG